MRGKKRGRKLKPVDEQAAEVIGRIIDRPHDLVPAQLTKPPGRRLEKGIRNLLIVDRLEHPEATDVGLMERVVLWIIARHDPPDDFTATPRQKKGGIAVLVKRMFLPIKELLPLNQERRDPGRVTGIDSPWEFDEGVAFGTRTDTNDFYLGHGQLISAAAGRGAKPQ